MSDTDEGPSAERLVFFTDAVVAIAITLLILPLVDLVPEVAAEHAPASEVVTGHFDQIGSFLLSFTVISRLWSLHHRLFGVVKYYRRSLVLWNMGWLLTIVLLPFPTEMIGAFDHDRFVGGFYTTTILAGVVCQTMMVLILRAHPELMSRPARSLDRTLFTTAASAGALVVALALALLVPDLQYYSLLLLLLVPLIDRFRHSGRPEAETKAVGT
jgi:uncharacterized membrane protein